MKKRDWWKKEFRWMVAIGDSITAGGWASCKSRCWASELSRTINEFQRTPVQLINVGIGGNVISRNGASYEQSNGPSALERLERDVLSVSVNGQRVHPDLVIVAYGLNDARGGTPSALFARELGTLIRRIRQRLRALVVLVGPCHALTYKHGPVRLRKTNLLVLKEYTDVIARVARKADCLFVNLLRAYSEAPWLVHRDGLHANDLAHRLIANEIFAALASNCSGLALESKYRELLTPPWRDESSLRLNPGAPPLDAGSPRRY